MSGGDTPQQGTIGRLWQDACRAGFTRPAFLAQQEEGWSPVSWDEAARQVDELAAGFAATGIDRGDRVALLARTRLEWTLVDMAVSSIGAVLVPIYPTSSAEEVNHIVRHCGVSLVVAETARQLRRAALAAGLATVVIEAEGEGSLSDLAARGRDLLAREMLSPCGAIRSRPATCLPTSIPPAPPGCPRPACSRTATSRP
jgi:long-chain acyl-CoA synthetase